MTPAAADITGVILAGGEGRRMGGVDKGLVTLRGRPLVAHVHQRLAPQVGTVLVNANRNADAYAAYGDRVVSDPPALAGWQGPLAGVAAGLVAARTAWVATVPCDTPWLPLDLVARLAHALQQGGRLAVAHAGGRAQPVCMLAARDLADDLLAWLAAGERKVDRWHAHVGAITVPFADANAFANLNTPQDLALHEA